MGKKTIFKIFILIVVLLASTIFSASTPIYNYKVILPDTKLYLSPDLSSEVIAKLPQNAVVTMQGESFAVGEFVWQKISYNTIEGYVLSHDLYESREIESYNIKRGKARSKRVGEDIKLYVSNDIESDIGNVIHDGENIDIVITKIDYGEFFLIEYKGGKYFALKENVSTALSLNQMLALIIGGSALVATLVIITIVISVKNRKLYKETA